MKREILKLKLCKDGATLVRYQQENKAAGKIDVFEMESHDQPLDALFSAVNDLARDVQQLCELPAKYTEGLEVIGVTFSYGGTGQGVTVTALKALKRSAAPLVINTPHMLVEDLDPPAKKRIEEVQIQVNTYLDGERAQMQLPFEGDGEKEAA